MKPWKYRFAQKAFDAYGRGYLGSFTDLPADEQEDWYVAAEEVISAFLEEVSWSDKQEVAEAANDLLDARTRGKI